MARIIIVLLWFSYMLFAENEVRPIKDRIGFATTEETMQKLFQLIPECSLKDARNSFYIICPHDDYLYAGRQYRQALSGLPADTFVIFGVYHSGQKKEIKNKIVLENFSFWETASGRMKVASLREKIVDQFAKKYYIIDDEVHRNEHSIEAIAIFLHQLYPQARIVPLIVSPSEYSFLEEATTALGKILNSTLQSEKIVLISSADAVHYGDEGWGGKDFQFFGGGKKGYRRAVKNELKISRLLAEATPRAVKKFFNLNMNPDLSYRLSWCGRFAISCGMLTAQVIAARQFRNLKNQFWKYETSVQPGKIADRLDQLGLTAPANFKHWVGYLAARFALR